MWALVTGASDGIGEAICHQLAASGINIVLVARSQEKIQKVAKDLKEKYNVNTIIYVYDFNSLNSPEAAQSFLDSLDFKTKNRDIGILVNNVGAYFAEPTRNICDMIHVNCCTQAILTKHYLAKWG